MLNSYIICQLVSMVTQTVKNLPAMRETWVQSLGCYFLLQCMKVKSENEVT